jgi:hypothetical protein
MLTKYTRVVLYFWKSKSRGTTSWITKLISPLTTKIMFKNQTDAGESSADEIVVVPQKPPVSDGLKKHVLSMTLCDAFAEYGFPSYDRVTGKMTVINTQKGKFFTKLKQAFGDVVTVCDLARLTIVQLSSPFGNTKIGHLSKWLEQFNLSLGVDYTRLLASKKPQAYDHD